MAPETRSDQVITAGASSTTPSGGQRARRLVWRGLAAAMLALVVAIPLVWWGVANTERGRRRVAQYAEGLATQAFEGRGQLRIGALTSLSPGAIVAQNVALLDTLGEPVLTVDSLRASVSVAELFNRVVRIRSLALSGMQFNVSQDATGPFNIQWLLSGPADSVPPVVRAARLGDDVHIDTLELRRGNIVVTYPWAPHPLFVGAERDSVTAVRDSLHELLRRPDGLYERRRVTIAELVAHDVHAITPTDAPGTLVIQRGRLEVSDPPVPVRDVRGPVTWYDDSLTFRADSIALPASRLSAQGRLSWADSGPVRYDVAIEAPQVALTDLNWAWPVLPRSGEASASVRLRTLENPDHLAVTLRNLSASAMASTITGDITVVAEVRDLLLRDVALDFAPMTTELASQLTEAALPPELRGRFSGRFVAREGGALTALRIDTLQLAFDDARVPGARSRLWASGVVGIGLEPTARDAELRDVSIDLRSVRTVVPELSPLVNGSIGGSARIASASLDAANVGDLAIVWTDEQGNVSRVTGRSAVRWVEPSPTVDVELAFPEIAMASFALVDTAFPGRGVLNGTLVANGRLDSLPFSAAVRHTSVESGSVVANGWFGVEDAASDSVRWRTAVTVGLDAWNARPWLVEGTAPTSQLQGTVTVAARGQAATVDTARVDASITQAATSALTPLALHGLASWGASALLVDSLLVTAPGARLEASGGLSRDSLGRESFRGSLRMDSLSHVRAELPRLALTLADIDTALASSARNLASDSLSGDLNISVYGEGSFQRYLTSVAVAGNHVRVGSVVAGRLFGSVRADSLPGVARFVAAAIADSVEGLAALRIATINAGIGNATAQGGTLRFDMEARDTSRLRMRGRFARGDDTLLVESDSVRFSYEDVVWTNGQPFTLRSRPDAFVIDSFTLASNEGGSLRLSAAVPSGAAARGALVLDRFPVGELAAFALGTQRLPGIVTGHADLSGIREDPTLVADFRVDSLGTSAATLSGIRLQAEYAAQQLQARVVLADTLGRSARVQLQLPADLRLQPVVGDRIYTEELSGEIVADSVRLRDLPLRFANIRDVDGFVYGRIDLAGTYDDPSIEGRMQLSGGTLFSEVLGIRPEGGVLDFRAGGDSLHVEQFRFRSGARIGDTLSLRATIRRPLRENPRVTAEATLRTVALARQRDGTDLDLSGTIAISGALPRPTVSANLFVPQANLVLDLTEARTVLDLNSPEARRLLAEDELPVVITAGDQFTALGEYIAARDVRVRLGNEVWVRTRDAAVKLAGEVNVLEADGRRLSLDGEVEVERGIYRLDLGVVNRPFAVDSGRVRFFPQDTLNPSLDIHAQYVVRGVDGRDVPIDVAINGTLEEPTLRLSSPDEAYARAPESEFISLLVFGAPTFALDGQSQQTVKAATGLLLPSFSNAVEGGLQRLLPVFNTVQVNTAGGQSGGQLDALSLLDNLSITAGKQIGTRTYLRLDTGVCRSLSANAAARALNLWYGIAVEYRLAASLTAQVGVDPGPSPCGSQLDVGANRRLQVGFDLFKEWVF